MGAVVVDSSEISLNAVRYKIIGRVQSALSSIYPEKQVTGDFTRDSQQYASVLAQSTSRGGIGLNRQRAGLAWDRCWWSTCQIRGHQHLVLPALATITAASGVAGAFTIGAIGELNNAIYAAFGTTILKKASTDSWGSSLATLPAAATHALNFRMNGVVYLAFATTGGYTYSSDGVTWTDDTRDASYLAWWDDRLWGIDSTGLLWFSTAIGVETDDAQLPLPDSSVTSLFVGPLADGELVLHAGTTYGLFSHDIENKRFVQTELPSSQHPDSGKGATRWRESIYFPSGNAVHTYGLGGVRPTISVMGPDRDDGLPSDKRGAIKQLVPTLNELLAVLDATTAPGTTLNMFTPGTAMNRGRVIQVDTGYSSILGWDENGWEVKWLGGSTAQAISYAYVSFAYSAYRLWWGHNQRVYYMSLPRDIINPSEITTFDYAASGDHETTWFNADQVEVDKLALELRIETSGCSATETVTISYGLDYATSYTSLGSITSNGITTYYFPSGTDPAGANTGTTFRAIRFKPSLARGSTTTLTPDMISLTLTYRKKLPAKYVHTVKVDLSGEYNGKSPEGQRAALISAIEGNAKVEFTFRNDTGLTRNYYVDVVQATGLEATGLDESGESILTLVEP